MAVSGASTCRKIWLGFALVIGILAISSSYASTKSKNSSSPIIKPSPLFELPQEASKSLHDLGYTFIATLLQFSPELLLSKPNSTIFAIHDDSIPDRLIRNLLRYHISPLRLSSTDLIGKPQGSCIPTLVTRKNLSISTTGKDKGVAEINGVVISHPDIFTHRLYSIHGVFTAFSPIDTDGNILRNPRCGNGKTGSWFPWKRIIRLLKANGFSSFASGLKIVLDRGLIDELTTSVTIFAPLDFGYTASSSAILERIVRSHILPQRWSYKKLRSLPLKTQLKTLDSVNGLEITEAGKINGLNITQPTLFSSTRYYVHGVPSTFQFLKL